MRPVSALQVKRCFVISNFVKTPPRHRRYLGAVSAKEFERRVAAAKKKVLRMSETELDARISPNYPRRLRAYNAMHWDIRTCNISDIGVWRRAGGLPLAWTRGSLAHTAKEVRRVLEKDPKLLRGRARHSISSMLGGNVHGIQKEKYLLPIVLAAGIDPSARRAMKKFKGDIDDGCMRSIALAVSGKKKIKVYFGTPIK